LLAPLGDECPEGFRLKFEGLIQVLASKFQKVDQRRKAAARPLFIKYRNTIDKYSHQRAVRLSKNPEFQLIFNALQNSSAFREFSKVDETLSGNDRILEALEYLINLKSDAEACQP
jgi:hypothetical protein